VNQRCLLVVCYFINDVDSMRQLSTVSAQHTDHSEQLFTFLALCQIKRKKLTSLQYRVRMTKSHVQNSTNHFARIIR